MDILQSADKWYHGFYSPVSVPERHSHFLTNILSYIEANLPEELTLDIVSRTFSTNKNKLQALIQEETGMTFNEYIRHQRLYRICYYLRFTELGLAEIAERTGFSSSQNLCRFFRTMTDKTPTRFRRDSVQARKRQFAEWPETASPSMGLPENGRTAEHRA